MADNIKIINKQNKAIVLFSNGVVFTGDADGDFVAANGSDGTDSVKVTRAEDSKVLLDVSDYTRIVDEDGTQIGSTRNLTVSNLNSNFLNPGTSITNIGDVIEDASIDKTAGKKLYLVMDNNKFKVTNIPDADLTDARFNVSQFANDSIRLRLTRSFQGSVDASDDVVLDQGTGITYVLNGTTVTINGFSGDYDDLTNKPTIPTDTNTNIGNTNMTLTGDRSVNMSGNDLDFKDGSTSKLKFDDSEDEWVFNAPVVFKQPSAIGEIRLQENPIGGDAAVVLKGPNTNIASDVVFNLPSADGTADQVLATNGSGVLSFRTISDGQDGQDGTNGTDGADGADGSDALALAGNDQTLTGNRVINTNGNDLAIKDGNVALISFTDATDQIALNKVTNVQAKTASGELRFKEIPTNGTNHVSLKAPDSMSADASFILPSADGTSGQFLKTDGSGSLSFGDAGGGSTFTQVYLQNFLDDIGTTIHYLPFKDINEQTTVYQEEAAMLMPFDGRVKSMSLRVSSLTGSGNFTVSIRTRPSGVSQFSAQAWTIEESEVMAFTSTDDYHTFHFVFDNAQHFEAGDLCTMSLMSSADPGGFSYWYVTTVVEFDTSTDLGSSSTEHGSNP